MEAYKIMNRIYKIILIVLSIFFVLTFSSYAQQGTARKEIKIILKVETEDQGTRLPTEKPLSNLETKQLRSAIIAGLNKLPYIKLVSSDEKYDAIGILVVAEKLVNKNKYILLSSVLTIAQANGEELFVTHNIIAAPNLEMAAKAVVYQFVSAQLQLSLK